MDRGPTVIARKIIPEIEHYARRLKVGNMRAAAILCRQIRRFTDRIRNLWGPARRNGGKWRWVLSLDSLRWPALKICNHIRVLPQRINVESASEQAANLKPK